MAVALRDIDELRRLILIYVPLNPARQLVGDLYRSKAAEHNASLKETLRQLHEAFQSIPTGATPYTVTLRATKITESETIVDDALDELRQHLTPGNENVTRGYVVAAIRDLAQIAVSSRDVADEYERTIASIATMLGWDNVPPRDVLERNIAALKARVGDVS